MASNQLLIIGDVDSPSFTFDGDAIMGASMDVSVNLIGTELCTDTAEFAVNYDDANGTLRALPWATPVLFYCGERLEGKFYSIGVTRTGRKEYQIRATSAAGILEYEKFYGGIYSGKPFQQVAELIIGNNGLQPYNGLYSTFERVVQLSGSVLNPFYMGVYRNQALTQDYGSGAYLTATMSSKLHAKIRVVGYQQTVADMGYTSARCHLLGATAAADGATDAKKHQYGLYMQMTRASAGVHYADFGSVYFCYGQTEISLGTPTAPTTYEIDADPTAGTVIINGTTYGITIPSGVANDPCPLHAYGSGVRIAVINGQVAHDLVGHTCTVDISEYAISTASGSPIASYALASNIFTGYKNCIDLVNKKIVSVSNNNAVFDDEDLVLYDVETYGVFPLFQAQTAFQTDILSRLHYADGVAALPVYGWIPICTKREALHQLLFAAGIIIIKDDDGQLLFTSPVCVQAGQISEDNVYDEGTDDAVEHVNSIILTEHSFVYDSSASAETIFENSSGSSETYYYAPYTTAPVYGTPTATGLTVYFANCNAAVVSGSGSLSAKPYAHGENILTRSIGSYPDGRDLSVPDATLVTLVNSAAVLDRLSAYYGSARKVKVDISLTGEKCGLFYALSTAFGDAVTGFLSRATKRATAIIRAACEFISGYTPPAISAAYSNYVILTGSGTWTVPDSVLEADTPRIRVVLIGGGQGGSSGLAGASGETPARGSGSTAAEGGAAGDAGEGGKVYDVTIDNPAASYTFSCGAGGEGGAISNSPSNKNLGSAGGDTQFSDGDTVYSSADGAAMSNGITNIFTGRKYAHHVDMATYAARMHGGSGGYHVASQAGVQYVPAGYCGSPFPPSATYQRGAEGAGYFSGGAMYASGGAGGGAGFGTDGANGGKASYTGGTYRGGTGGKGGDATSVPPKATEINANYYGYGGCGGGGGGGGGAGGWVTAYYTSAAGSGGAGGYGGQGGDGGDGCVLIYY